MKRQFVRYRDKNKTIVYAKGMTKEDIINYISSRMDKRQKELDKRLWIVKEYDSLKAKQNQDAEWCEWVKCHFDQAPIEGENK